LCGKVITPPGILLFAILGDFDHLRLVFVAICQDNPKFFIYIKLIDANKRQMIRML
jgi:hypothetical protein